SSRSDNQRACAQEEGSHDRCRRSRERRWPRGAGVAFAVAVGVCLVEIADSRAIVANVTPPVLVAVCLIEIEYRRAVVIDIGDKITVIVKGRADRERAKMRSETADSRRGPERRHRQTGTTLAARPRSIRR